MRCTQCAAVSYSAAARTLVKEGYRCPVCGGAVKLAPQEPPVAVTSDPDPPARRKKPPGEGGRRFERE
jgi:hypothetical protein